MERLHEAVNLSADELEAWLKTEESAAVGSREQVGGAGEEGESIGHRHGRELVRILRTPEGALTEADLQIARKAVGFIRRHTAPGQGPRVSDPARSRWRFALMNWGHDPLRVRGEHET